MAVIKRRNGAAVQGADLTPMIDVVFLLLVFFMVATNFVEETQQYQIELPKAEEAEIAKLDQTLSIIVQKFNQAAAPEQHAIFRVQQEQVARADLYRTIKQVCEERDLLTVVIKADKNARYQDIISVISCLHAQNINDFSLAVLSQ